MPLFTVKSRKNGPIVVAEIDALHREDAIAQTMTTVVEGEEIDIMEVVELTPAEAPPEGGATGATGATGTSRRSR